MPVLFDFLDQMTANVVLGVVKQFQGDRDSPVVPHLSERLSKPDLDVLGLKALRPQAIITSAKVVCHLFFQPAFR